MINLPGSVERFYLQRPNSQGIRWPILTGDCPYFFIGFRF